MVWDYHMIEFSRIKTKLKKMGRTVSVYSLTLFLSPLSNVFSSCEKSDMHKKPSEKGKHNLSIVDVLVAKIEPRLFFSTFFLVFLCQKLECLYGSIHTAGLNAEFHFCFAKIRLFLLGCSHSNLNGSTYRLQCEQTSALQHDPHAH